MKNLFQLFLLFTLSSFGQEKPLVIKIDAIKSDNSNPKERKFTIQYHISNTTKDTIYFFLNPNTIIPNAVSSMALQPIYRIYQNNQFIDVDGVFEDYIDENGNDKKRMEEYRIKYNAAKDSIVSNYKKKGGKNTDENWILRNHFLLKSYTFLLPNETRNYVISTIWYKKRYFYNDPMEYYLSENNHYKIEFFLHLLKDELKDRLSSNEFRTITGNKNFINGLFYSNQVDIDFGE